MAFGESMAVYNNYNLAAKAKKGESAISDVKKALTEAPQHLAAFKVKFMPPSPKIITVPPDDPVSSST